MQALEQAFTGVERTGNEAGLEYIFDQQLFWDVSKPSFSPFQTSHRAGRIKQEYALSAEQAEIAANIRDCTTKGDLRRVLQRVGEGCLRQFLLSLYPALSLGEIETATGIPDSTLGYWFRRLRIPTNARHARSVSVLCDEDGFSVMGTPESAVYEHKIMLTPELAYLIGFALGDGTIETYSVATFNKEETVVRYLQTICEKYGKVTYRKREDGLHKLRLSSRKIACLIRENGKIREDTVDYVLNDPECSKYFIAAFWDAEGSVAAKQIGICSSNVVLYNSNKQLLEKIASALSGIGIETTIISYAYLDRKYILKGRPLHPRKVMHKLRVKEAFVLRWAQTIGSFMQHPKKQERVKAILQGDKNGG